MSVDPCIDVILLSWNRVSMTIETVQNLLEQQGIDLRIWIVDQGSKTEELQLLKQFTSSYSNVHIEELGKNVGVPGGRNIGTRLGQAPYTVSIDNDAVFESPFALKQVVEIFDENPRIGVISFRVKNFYTGLDDELSWVYPKSLKVHRDKKFLVTRFVGCGHSIRRSVFEQVRGYDDDLFFYWEETDFSYRVINLGYQLLYEPKIVVLHKVSPEARVEWTGRRYYFLVRNALYINFKYNRSILKVVILTLGYLMKGLYNRLFWQTLTGVLDACNMCKQVQLKFPLMHTKLTEEASTYIFQYETVHRGSLWNRLKTEVFTILPTYK